jgi:hypothetical protein
MYIDHTDDYVVEISEEGMRRAMNESPFETRMRPILVTVTLERCVVRFHALAPSTFDALGDALEMFFGVPMMVCARVA